MLDNLRALSKALFIIPILIFIYDLITGWVFQAEFYIRSTREVWVAFDYEAMRDIGREIRSSYSKAVWDNIMKAPFVVWLFLLGIIFYTFYRILFRIFGHRGGKIRYKRMH